MVSSGAGKRGTLHQFSGEAPEKFDFAPSILKSNIQIWMFRSGLEGF
jgi:hypothetical protein